MEEKGITLIEIIVVIAIITLFSMILIADYPKIKRQFALSRAVYKFAQDLRKTQDLGLSGVQIKNSAGEIIVAKGYGVYINLSSPTEYKIYADTSRDDEYTLGEDFETIDISKQEAGVFITAINNIGSYRYASINFNPPNPKTTIDNLESDKNSIEVVFALSVDQLINRKVSINTSGLIEVK